MDLEQQIAEAVWAWRRAAVELEAYEVQDVDDLTARDGRVLDELRAEVEAKRQALTDLSTRRIGAKTYEVAVERNGRWLMIHVPELDCVTQAKRPATVKLMARDLIAVWLDVPEDSFDLRVHTRLREMSGSAAGEPTRHL